MRSKRYTGDPAFKAEIDQIAADHAMQPISAAEREKLATPITDRRYPSTFHTHEEDCWGEVVERTIFAPGANNKIVKVKVQICRRGGAIREVKE